MTNKPRPISVTLISWLHILTSGINLLSVPFTIGNNAAQQYLYAFGVSTGAAVLVAVVGSAINLTCGIGMLYGKNWARLTYFYSMPLLVVFCLVLYHFQMPLVFLSGFLLYVVFVVILTRHPVNEFFSAEAQSRDVPPPPVSNNVASGRVDGNRIASIVLLVPGGFLLMTGFMMTIPLAINVIALIIGGAFFGLLSCAFIVPAVILWGRKRWAIVLGTMLVSVGGLLTLNSLVFYEIGSIPEFQAQLAVGGTDILTQMTRGSLLSRAILFPSVRVR